MVRTLKKEPIINAGRSTRSSVQNINGERVSTNNGGDEDTTVERRVLRSKYLRFKNRITDERDDISKVDADKFKSMIDEVDSLHQLVQKPREQVADAEALFDITNTLVSSVKAYRNEGMTPSDFVSCLLRDFGQQGGASSSQDAGRNLIKWKEIGHMVSHVFRVAPGCCTMVGSMNTELKQRKTVVHRKRTKPTEDVRPEELDDSVRKEKTDTDKNMAIMFDILRRNRHCKLENLILNRHSFAQTVENLFALSFLIKDGRAEIAVDENRCHLVSPRNAPSSNAILSGEASYSHFIFRFDFKDWKLMLSSVEVGDELMPHRYNVDQPSSAQPNSVDEEAEAAPPTTPIRKLSRNRGLVMQEQIVVEDSPESGDTAAVRAAAIRKGKRKLT
ncbi:non-structural maintenance of chromosomes element 4A-like [Dorcoceras hygrometricum]|uniref:Non-structural maintenance of chromosomes element 4 n=1 Tax=Dorcoceras hygrometricum TaxID=472368 RepID=A0A2Z7BW16_9LAMI|nr:non-structural maintenance of chromosomes element 4A-like [Dorcoceras hygrometricum]